MIRPLRLLPALLATAALVIGLGAASPAAAADMGASMGAPTSITLRPSVMVEDSVIRLSDLFEGSLNNGATPVARAPAPGASVVLDARWLLAVAQTYDVAWRPASRFEQTVVGRASQRIGGAEVRDALRTAIRRRGIEGPVEIALDGGEAAFHLPTDVAATARVEKMTLDRGSGRFAAMLVAPADGPPLARGAVAGRIFPLVEVPVPTRRLMPGEVIGRSDLEWKLVRADRITRTTVADIDRLAGKTPRRPLNPGDPIRRTEIERTVAVEKGSLVTMALHTSQMSLTVRGRAMQDGAEGDLIRVMNTNSNRIVQAVVVDAGTVVIANGPARLN